MTFGLNQMTARNLPILRFLDVARESGCRGVELRNDLSQPLFDGMSAHQAGKEAQARDLTVFCLSEVYGFNDLTAERLDQVHELISLAQALGAAAIGLIPRNDGQDCDASTRKANLRAALREIAPLLRAAGIVGMIEPLGFETASLRLKAEAIDAIEATGNAAEFKIIHDTFHHHIAGETLYFPQATGMMHVSGVTDPTLGADQMRDAHRGLWMGLMFWATWCRSRKCAAKAMRGRSQLKPSRRMFTNCRSSPSADAGRLSICKMQSVIWLHDTENSVNTDLRHEIRCAGHHIGRKKMKKILITAGLTALMSTSAMAQEIGATFSRFDDNWLTVLRNGMVEYAATIDGLSYQQEDATDDLAKQIDQVKNFVAQGVDAIIVNIVDTSAGAAVSAAAGDTPLVYVNREPDNVNELPATQAFVASNEIESGTLSAFEVCKNLRAEGKAGGARGYLMNGQLSNQAAVQRSKDVHDVIGMDMCNFMTIIDEQTANWSRDEAQDLMTNWMSSGEPFDFVLANNDEMAIGAIQAMKAAGMDMADVQVGGVDASQDALLAMAAGDYDVTVFQDSVGQGTGSIDTALRLIAGEKVDKKVYIPFVLVTPDNMGDFLDKN